MNGQYNDLNILMRGLINNGNICKYETKYARVKRRHQKIHE